MAVELKERIALARKQAGLSQEQLGEKLGVSRQAVSKWESGQTNPDLAYVVGMCRLFGVSSDWLLMGEESERETVPARCPNCQSVVTGLDSYCPKCGRNLKSGLADGYTLVLKASHTAFTLDDELRKLSRTGWFSPESPLHEELSSDQAKMLINEAPVILGRGLSVEHVRRVKEKVMYPDQFAVYRDSDGDDPGSMLYREEVPASQYMVYQQPMSFGGVVLAVIVGVVGAIFLLSFL